MNVDKKSKGAVEEERGACRYRCRRPRGTMSVGHGNDVAHGRGESRRALHSNSALPVSSFQLAIYDLMHLPAKTGRHTLTIIMSKHLMKGFKNISDRTTAVLVCWMTLTY